MTGLFDCLPQIFGHLADFGLQQTVTQTLIGISRYEAANFSTQPATLECETFYLSAAGGLIAAALDPMPR
jgi:hypothetical protein